MSYESRLRGIGKLGALAMAGVALLPALFASGGSAANAAPAREASGANAGRAKSSASGPAGNGFALTGPGAITIAESDDYATQVQADPWDMNNSDDLDFPHNFTLPTIGNGIWSATTTGSSSDPQMFVKLVEQNFPGTFSYIGEKDGRNYPVSTPRFTRIVFRMYSDQAGQMMLWWYKNPGDAAPCSNCNLTEFIAAQPGWHIYEANLNADPSRWANLGTVAGIRLDAPWNKYNNNVKFDWVRLVPDTSEPVQVTFRASGGGTVNFYLGLTSDPNSREVKIGSASATAGSWTWDRTGVAPGTYYIHGELGGAWSTTGPITVNAAPVLQLIAPGPLTGEDFAAARLGEIWDGSNPNQLDLYENLTGPPSYNGEYLQATSKTLPGTTHEDPSIYWLYPFNGRDRGGVDPARYRYFTVNLWLQAPTQRPNSKWNAGPRLTWSRADGGPYVQTEAVLAPYNRWIPMAVDLATVPKVGGSDYGWSGNIRIFRLDPHEEDDTAQPPLNLPFFRVRSAHLMTEPIANNATLVRWAKVQGGGTVSLYYDTDNSGFNGQLIAANVPIDQGLLGWNTSNLPGGQRYWVYAVADDGTNTSQYYSLLPVLINHGSASTIFTDVPTNNPFANDIANLAARNIINGYGQPDGTIHFRPGATATRAQLSKMVVLGAGGDLVSPNSPSFMDVPASSPLYIFVETAAARGIISGYPCGTRSGEPCDGSGRNYFRPNNNVTRAQTAKMIVLSRGWSEYRPATSTFADVPGDSPLFGFVEESARRGIIGGYPCGGPGEPCGAGNKPYFRPNRDVTRGQISKMLSQAIGPFTGVAPAK